MDIGNELIARGGELGELLAREEVNPLKALVIYRSGQFFHYFAAEVHRQIDDRAESVRPASRSIPARAVGSWPSSAWVPHGDGGLEDRPASPLDAVIFKPANLVPASAWAL